MNWMVVRLSDVGAEEKLVKGNASLCLVSK